MQLFAAALLTAAGFAADPYGNISDLKLKKPEDGVSVKRTPAPNGAEILFNGKSLESWMMRSDEKKPATWDQLEGGAMQARDGDIITTEQCDGSFKLHVEVRVPYVPDAKGQARGNSGVCIQGRYEAQVLDSCGLDSKNNNCGAIYEVSAPLVNACKAPTVWQSYAIDFTEPKCEGGKKTDPAHITVHQNGVLIQDDVKIPVDNTRAGRGGDPCTPGPIMLQYHGNPVQFRNIWLVKGKLKKGTRGDRERLSPNLPFSLSVSAGQLGGDGVCCSNRVIFSTRRAWRPLSNSVSNQIRNIRSISSSPSRSADRHSTLASLCRRLISAVMLSWHGAARTPLTLLAAMHMPMPVPQIRTPRWARPSLTARAA